MPQTNNYTDLTTHHPNLSGIQSDKQNVAKKRITYEGIYDERRAKIEKMSLEEIKEHREELKVWLQNTEDMMQENGISDQRKRYLVGLKKHAILPLLNYTKERRADINRVVSNGTPRNLAVRFVAEAAKQLPMELFQRIYGAALCRQDMEQMSMDQVREFMRQSVQQASDAGFRE